VWEKISYPGFLIVGLVLFIGLTMREDKNLDTWARTEIRLRRAERAEAAAKASTTTNTTNIDTPAAAAAASDAGLFFTFRLESSATKY
jgi:hypothetical protein